MATDPGTVVHLLSTLEGGGTERVLLRLLHALPRPGPRHVVVTLRAAGAFAARLPDDVICHALHCRGRAVAAGVRAAWRLRHDNVSLIHARGIRVWRDAILMRVLHPRARLILGFHGLDSDVTPTLRQRRRIRQSARLATRVACVAESGRDWLVHAGVPAHRIDVLPNGVDLTLFSPPTPERRRRLRDSFGWPEDRVVALCVSSLVAIKGHRTLIRAIDTLGPARRRLRVVLIGDGPLRGDLEREVRSRGLGECVTFLGRREDVPDLMRAADLLICPSLSESMSNALLEGMACGLAVVATDVGEARRLLGESACSWSRFGKATAQEPWRKDGKREGCGVMAPPGDSAALAAALHDLIDKPERREVLGRAAARRAASTCSLAGMVERYNRYYRDLLSLPPALNVPTPAARRLCEISGGP